MKFRVTMKDPDTLHDAIQEAVEEWAKTLPDIDDDEREAIEEKRREKVDEICGTWFGYGEYLTVEIDTDAKTCVVIPDSEVE